VPLWLSPFECSGQQYQALMVGTDPAQGSVTTVVPTVIVPLRLVFARDGSVLDAPGMAQELANSPLFTSVPYVVGTTQYADAHRRADFWSAVATTSPDYHTLLGGPTILPTRTLTVPAALGHTFFSPDANRSFGYVDGQWFSLQVKQLIVSLQIAGLGHLPRAEHERHDPRHQRGSLSGTGVPGIRRVPWRLHHREPPRGRAGGASVHQLHLRGVPRLR
jgi:hypothetical protein